MIVGSILLLFILFLLLIWVYYQFKVKDILWKMRKIPLLDENMYPIIGDINFVRKTTGHGKKCSLY